MTEDYAHLMPKPNNEPTLYDRVRAWGVAAGVTDPIKEFLCCVEETGETEQAIAVHAEGSTADMQKVMLAIMDGIGDIAVTAIILHDTLTKELGRSLPIEFCEPDGPMGGFATVLGSIAEGLRKPKKVLQATAGCVELLAMCKTLAADYSLDFETDCLGLVVPIIESRLEGGKLVNGTFVKGSDL